MFMFDYIKYYILDELKRLFSLSYHIQSYITRSSEVFYMPKGNTTRFGIDTLNLDCAKLRSNFILNC